MTKISLNKNKNKSGDMHTQVNCRGSPYLQQRPWAAIGHKTYFCFRFFRGIIVLLKNLNVFFSFCRTKKVHYKFWQFGGGEDINAIFS